MTNGSYQNYNGGALCDSRWKAYNDLYIQSSATTGYNYRYFSLQELKNVANGLILNYWGGSYSSLVCAEVVQVTASTTTDVVYGNPVTVNAKNDWLARWDGVPTVDVRTGEYYTYYVVETAVNGYTTTYQVGDHTTTTASEAAVDPYGKITVTNTKQPETTSITVKKEWKDSSGNTITAPQNSITFDLYQLASGETSTDGKTPILSGLKVRASVSDGYTAEGGYGIAYGEWTTTISNLPKTGTDSNNQTVNYVYVVKETTTGGFETTYETAEDGTLVIKNTVPTTSIVVNKEWKNADGSGLTLNEGSVTFDLYRIENNAKPEKTVIADGQNGTKVNTEPLTITASNWTATVSDLPTMGTSSGTVVYYTYYVVETPVEGYDTAYAVDGTTVTVTNTKQPETTSITVKKVWGSGTDGHPDSITFDLYRIESTTPPTEQTVAALSEGETGVTVNFVHSQGSKSVTVTDAVVGGSIQVTAVVNFQVDPGWGTWDYDDVFSISGADGPATIPTWTVDSSTNTSTIQFLLTNVDSTVGIQLKTGSWSEYLTLNAVAVGGSTEPSAEPGTKYREGLTICSENNWMTTVSGLPLTGTTSDGQTVYYIYYVKETTTGYDVTYSNNDGITSGTITITNSQTTTPSGTQLKVKKEWMNADGTDLTVGNGYSVTVQLAQVATTVTGGTQETTTKETRTGNWQEWTFTDEQLSNSNLSLRITYTTDAGYYNWGYAAICAKNASGTWGSVWDLKVASGEAGTYTDTVPLTSLSTDDNCLAVNFWGSHTPEGGTEITYATLDKVELIETVITGGTTETVVNENFKSATLDSKGNWEYTWSNLPAKDGNTTYTYYVKEVSMSNGGETNFGNQFHVTVDHGNGTDTVGPSGTVTVTNTLKSTYTLPETGGGGAKPYTLGGLLLCFTAGALLLYSHSSRRKEDSISS